MILRRANFHMGTWFQARNIWQTCLKMLVYCGRTCTSKEITSAVIFQHPRPLSQTKCLSALLYSLKLNSSLKSKQMIAIPLNISPLKANHYHPSRICSLDRNGNYHSKFLSWKLMTSLSQQTSKRFHLLQLQNFQFCGHPVSSYKFSIIFRNYKYLSRKQMLTLSQNIIISHPFASIWGLPIPWVANESSSVSLIFQKEIARLKACNN